MKSSPSSTRSICPPQSGQGEGSRSRKSSACPPTTRSSPAPNQGIGIAEVLEAIVTRIPPPKGDRNAPLKAMLVDSWYDPYLGVVILVRVIDGSIRKGQQVKFMAAGTSHLIDRVGCMRPKIEILDELGPGEVGFITAQIKEVAQTRVGDTITDAKRPPQSRCPGSRKCSPWCSAASSPPTPRTFEKLRESISAKLRLNDASFSFEMEISAALGFGFRCGFLGLLHLEIIQERLTREYDLDLITTAPSVVYKLKLGRSKTEDARDMELHNPADMPDVNRIEEIQEPWIEATIYCPDEYLGSILKLCQDRRGIQNQLTYVGGRAQLVYELPLNEVVFDFYDRLKSIKSRLCVIRLSPDRPPRGRPCQDEHHGQFRSGRRAEHDRPPQHRGGARPRHVRTAERPDPPPPVQNPDPGGDWRQDHRPRNHRRAAQGCDREMLWRRYLRKKKLLEKQKKGKARMREYGSVSIPQEAFIAALRMGEE
jgi:GTP-binding protein LepA